MEKTLHLNYWQENLDDLSAAAVTIGDADTPEDGWMHIYKDGTDTDSGATLVNMDKEDAVELARFMLSTGLVSIDDLVMVKPF
jgi:hypothetical protein